MLQGKILARNSGTWLTLISHPIMITAAIIAHTILIALILKSVVSFSLIVNINLTRIYITLTRINAKKSITNNNLYILMPDMFCKTDVEKVIPPTKASTMEAKNAKYRYIFFFDTFYLFLKILFCILYAVCKNIIYILNLI